MVGQNVLLWLITIPVYVVCKGPTQIQAADVGYDLAFTHHSFYLLTLMSRLTVIFLALLVLETAADQEHWNFQSLKHALKPAERLAHPNKVQFSSGLKKCDLFNALIVTPSSLCWALAGYS